MMAPFSTRASAFTNKDAERKADDVLRALENSGPVTAPPFFATRVNARLRQEMSTAATRRLSPAVRISFAVAAVALLIGLNVYSLVRSSDQTIAASKEQERESFAEQYNLINTQY